MAMCIIIPPLLTPSHLATMHFHISPEHIPSCIPLIQSANPEFVAAQETAADGVIYIHLKSYLRILKDCTPHKANSSRPYQITRTQDLKYQENVITVHLLASTLQEFTFAKIMLSWRFQDGGSCSMQDSAKYPSDNCQKSLFIIHKIYYSIHRESECASHYILQLFRLWEEEEGTHVPCHINLQSLEWNFYELALFTSASWLCVSGYQGDMDGQTLTRTSSRVPCPIMPQPPTLSPPSPKHTLQHTPRHLCFLGILN